MPRKPNILLLVADQVTPFLTSPYGDPTARTPAMDRLAHEGVRFDAAYCPFPLCAPSRASLITGKDASRLGCLDNASILPADQPTLGHYASIAGYDTALSGKMHFIGPDQLHGFRKRLTTDVFPAGVGWVPKPDEDGTFPGGGHARHYTASDAGVRTWTTFMAYDEETQFRALEYLRAREFEHVDPFCLVVSFHHPHDPFHVRPEYWNLYDESPIALPTYPEDLDSTYSTMDRWANDAHETTKYDVRNGDNLRQLRRAYYASLSYVDRKIGQLLDALAESRELDDTLVLFTSDHGDMLGEHGMVQKRCFYEWSARVPLLMRLPGKERAGTTVSTPVSLIDILPTALDVIGFPESERMEMDGFSLLRSMDASESDQRPIFSEYHLEKVHAPCFMVRRGRFKYIYIHRSAAEPSDSQLFDLDLDPGEWHNLSGSVPYAGLERELRDLVLSRFDPDQLAAVGAESIERRMIVKKAMARNNTHWDYSPSFDGSAQYIR